MAVTIGWGGVTLFLVANLAVWGIIFTLIGAFGHAAFLGNRLERQNQEVRKLRV